MQKNLYYRTRFKRINIFKTLFLSLFDVFASTARLTLEVFTRKNFGERYFLLSSALWVSFIYALIPYVVVKYMASPRIPTQGFNFDTMAPNQQEIEAATSISLMPDYFTWYLFIALHIGLSFKHYLDMRHNPSVFDFKHFSLSSGKVNPLFFRIKLPLIQTNIRTIECLFEPALFFVAGILLWLIGQKLGILLVFASIFYSFSYINDYIYGDHYVMDKIDEMILNKELEKSFVYDLDENETRGFRFRGKRPNDPDMRRQLLASMMDEEEILTVE